MVLVFAVGVAILGTCRSARGQSPPDPLDDGPGGRFKVLTGPDALDQLDQLPKDRLRRPIEIFRAQFAPFDVLPFVKARHWTTINLEARSNYEVYEGRLQTAVVPMWGMAQGGATANEVRFRRDVRMPIRQEVRLSLQAMLPTIPRELPLELTRPDAIRPDEGIQASLRVLEPHQMLVVVLAGNPNDYGNWSKLPSTMPVSGDRDVVSMDRQRYYRFAIPQDAETPVVSPHPLAWTTISHVLWDNLDPEFLNVAQQESMIDWLHWGGQLIIVGGASPSLGLLRDSFLGPYLPADVGGTNHQLDEEALRPLSEAYLPPETIDEYDLNGNLDADPVVPVPIRPESNRPVYLAGLRPRQGVGAVALPIAKNDDRLLGVERRVGRGRVTMLSVNLTDPALVGWPGFDSLVRRVVLRRPRELPSRPPTFNVGGPRFMRGRPPLDWRFECLSGPDLSWIRYVARDLGATASPDDPRQMGEVALPRAPVADWDDHAFVPTRCRDALKDASGISIPSSNFILKVIVAYIVALVPLNWLVCRFILRRREWAWVMVPVLALGFAIGVERAAAYDLGFDSACDEIDLLELQAGHPRAHLSRFASLYTTGRVGFTVAYPDEPSALALPMATGDELRGEEPSRSEWQSLPIPSLIGLQVQPRSLKLFRAEQMIALPGSIERVEGPGAGRIVNGTGLELRDAVLVEIGTDRRFNLATIAPGATIDLAAPALSRMGKTPVDDPEERWIDLEPLLGPLRDHDEGRLEGRGEWRLVAWAVGAQPGQALDPEVDRTRGLTLVVAHLGYGPPPRPDGPRYVEPSRAFEGTDQEAGRP